MREKFAALSTPGVAKAVPIIVSFTDWRKPTGGSTLVVIIGADAEDGGLSPWNVVEGDVSGLGARDAVIVDKSYLSDLGLNGVGDTAQIGASRVRVAGMTDGIRSFTVTPYVFTTLNRARSLLDMPADNDHLRAGQAGAGRGRRSRARGSCATRCPTSEVLTKAEFHDRSLNHWLFATGAGVALIGGAILGLVVGTVIVAQTLYSSTKDHINEFATLRALGSSSGYIHRVILAQAALSAVLGYALGMIIAMTVVYLSEQTAAADRHDARARGLAARPDRRHVRHLRAVGHRQGDADRSSSGIQPMSADGSQHADRAQRRARPCARRQRRAGGAQYRQGARATARARRGRSRA